MLSRKARAIRYAFGALFLAALSGAQLSGILTKLADANSTGVEPRPAVATGMAAAVVPQSSSCISGALGPSDQTYNRPSAIISPSCVPTNTFPFYDAYTFNVSGCTNPSVTISTCTGPCGTQSSLDTILFVYQKAGGAPATTVSPIFAPANPCTNIQAANNNFCSPASQITMTIQTTTGSGDFVVVVTSNLAGQTGAYNLRVDTPGCVVTQVASCIYSLSSSDASFLAAGGSSSVSVNVAAGCPWTAVSNDSFITVDSGSPGVGNGTVNYTVAANSGPARVGTMTIAAQTFTITQEAGAVALPCISDALVSGNGTFTRPSTATVPPTCPPGPNPPIMFYKAYEFTLGGCPSGSVTASTCGTSPCSGAGTLADTVLFFYRKSDGSASSPGSPIFDPMSPCNNVVSGNNNFCGTLAQLTTTLNAGSFVVVVTSNGGGQTGTFNLSLTAPGCTLSTCPSITGTVTGGGSICAGGSSTVTVTISGGSPNYTVTLSNGGGTQTGPSPLVFSVSPAFTTTYSVTSASDSAGCPANVSGSATVTVDQPPTTANAGPDQNVCGSSATLAANTPSVGTGTWSVVSGSGSFTNSHDPNTTVTGLSAGANVLRWTITNGACSSADEVTINSSSAGTVSALGNANVWVGLKNSDDVGTKFDFLAAVLKNGVVVGSGQINDQPGGSSGFNNAILRTISMALSSGQSFCAGDTLSFRLSVRIAASSTHVSGTARLWYNDSAANSRFTATVNGTPTDYFLLDGFVLGTSAGPGPKKTSDVLVNRNVGGNPFLPFGTWTKTF